MIGGGQIVERTMGVGVVFDDDGVSVFVGIRLLNEGNVDIMV